VLDDDLVQIEEGIRRLQIEWDKFFAGVERKPPVELKGRIEALIRRHAFGEIRNNTQRFRYQTLTARYNTFNEMWNKRLRAIEEGRPWTGARPTAPPPSTPPEPRRPQARSDGAVRVAGGADSAAMRALFDRFMEAREKTGEGGAVKYEAFEKLIAKQASRIVSEQGARAVDFRLEAKDGKVSLKAKPVK
jgi:hypothetical protein